MRRGLARIRWGGKGWWPRWVCVSWRRSSVVGVGVSIWLCLITVVHLSVQPSPLLSQPLPQWQARTALPTLQKIRFHNLHHSMGFIGAGKDASVLEVNGTESDTGDGPHVSRMEFQVGPDQRVLLTKEEFINDAGDDLYLEESVSENYRQQQEHNPIAQAQSQDLPSFSSSVPLAGEPRETQLERVPVSRRTYQVGGSQKEQSVLGDPSSSSVGQDKLYLVPFVVKNEPVINDVSNHSSSIDNVRYDTRVYYQSSFNSLSTDTVESVTNKAAKQGKGYSNLRHSGQFSNSKREQTIAKQHIPTRTNKTPSLTTQTSVRFMTRKNHDTLRKEVTSDNSVKTTPVRPLSTSHGVLDKSHTEAAMDVETRLKKDGFFEHAYNVTASNALPIDRHVPDTRPEGCPRVWPDVTSVGPVSVIICTHNEAASVLRRTVYSVLRQTPSHLLSDIIVVDDNSTIGEPARVLEGVLEEVGARENKLRILHTTGRQGLVRARLVGAEAARGKVLVFLDSHCECGPQWLTPLLTALLHDKRKVVSPYIDVIRSESFTYVRSPDNLQGDFNWRLEFGWRAIPLDELAARKASHVPIRTPVISGGLFAVDRQYFFDIGAYDQHMDIWGGENMELSFRVWMCGGKLEIIPCSRVGHVFRSSVPYTFPDGRRHTVLRNLARAARVWMDEYSPYFFAAVNMTPTYDVGDVTSREALRERLGCRSFQWYLDHVAKHLHVPSPLALQYGQMKNRGSLLCLTSTHAVDMSPLRLLACHGSPNQTVELLQTGSLHLGAACVSLSANKCLTLAPCHRSQGLWTARGKQIYLDGTELCLTSIDNEFVHLETCRPHDPFQHWEPSYTFTWST